MANLILHNDGAYNLYTTIADVTCYTKALTLLELYEAVRFSGGQDAVDKLPDRLKRAHATGCSSIHGETLEQCISCNRAGPGESRMSTEAFIEEFLTLPTAATPLQPPAQPHHTAAVLPQPQSAEPRTAPRSSAAAGPAEPTVATSGPAR